MSVICKLIGHHLCQELQATDSTPTIQDEWKFHKRVTTVYICKRCTYTFTNKVNFGNPVEKETTHGD